MRTIAQMSFISLSIVTLGLAACQGQPIEDIGTVAQASSVPPNTVLILNGSGSPLGAGYESWMATNAGFNVEVVDPVGWAAKTATDFADYEAIIIGAINGSANVHELDPAVLNPAWATAATGNIIVVGTDPGAHVASGAELFAEDALRFAASGSGTGAYISLSAYYFNAAPLTPVPVLAPLGSFTVKQPAACYNHAHQVATHPTMTLVSDGILSNWQCSPLEIIDGFPATFQAHVIVEDFAEPGALSFTDGSVGLPYVVSRGAQPTLCGNNIIDPGEQCDDGNHASGDGCTEKCQLNSMICGDWDIDLGEQCDDGNIVDGDGCSSTCQRESPPSIGTCCLSGGGCQDPISPDGCVAIGGVYAVDNLVCSQVEAECPGLLGACCLPQGGCADATSDIVCGSSGGAYLGMGTTCASNGLVCLPPPSNGACCLPNGTCLDAMPALKCAANQGAYYGDGTTCAGAGGKCMATIITGACCVDNGCSELTAAQCDAAGGSFAGPGTICNDTTCPGCTDPVGACCVEHQCLVLSAQACQTNGGLYAGDASLCSPDLCACGPDDVIAAVPTGCSMTAPGTSNGGWLFGILGAALLARRGRKQR